MDQPANNAAIRSSAVLCGLWALAVVQPILDVLRRAPEFFVAHRADLLDATGVAAALGFAVPLSLSVVVVLAGHISRKLVDPLMAAFVGGLGAILAAQIAYRLGVSGWVGTAILAIPAAGALGAAWLRMSGVRTFLLVLSPAALVVPLFFLVFLGRGPLRSADASQAEPAGPSSAARAAPVVIIVFDELSLVSLLDEAGNLNAVRYPNLAALAADGIWFRNATAVSDRTRWALPAIVTGRYPVARSTPTPRDHPDTIFSLVGSSHRLEVSEAVTALCPPELCGEAGPSRVQRQAAMAADILVVAGHVLLPLSARVGLPDLRQNWAGFDADEEDDGSSPGWRQIWGAAPRSASVATAEAFIDRIARDEGKPTFYFIHTLATHQPTRWLPSGQRILRSRAIPGLINWRWTDQEWLVAQHHHGDILQAGLADTLVGRLRERLSSAGIDDEALVIVTADHGVSLTPGEHPRSFSSGTAAEIVSVPLIVRPPRGSVDGLRGTTDDSNVETIDILPTVARVLGVGVPWRVDGRSVIGTDRPRPEKKVFFNEATRIATFKPDELRASRESAAQRQADMFGVDKWPAFALPGGRGLVGRDITSFGDIGTIEGVQVAFDERDTLTNVDPKAAEVPAQLLGRFVQPDSAAGAARHVLAIALNGTLVATTRAWPESLRWMAMLPPDRLRPGPNDIEVFVVDSSRPDRLRRPRQ